MNREKIAELALAVLDDDLDFLVVNESEEAFFSTVKIALEIQTVRELKRANL